MKRALLFCCLLVSSTAIAAPQKNLTELNALTQLIVPKGDLPEAERPGLPEIAAAVAARDEAIVPSPQGVIAAAVIERYLDDKLLPQPLAARVMAELALSLARFDGPDALHLEQPFYRGLLAQLNINPDDAVPRPNLHQELAEIGAWATAMAEKVAARLPGDEGARVRARAALARGKWSEAEQLARRALKTAPRDGRWQAWLAAALLLQNKQADAAPFVAAAHAAGGEPQAILFEARQQRARVSGVERASKALKAPTEKLNDACKKFFEGLSATTAKGAKAADTAAACAGVLWQDAYADWLQRAVSFLPPGTAGGALRAANHLRLLFGQDAPKRPDESEREKLLQRYLDEVKALALSDDERRVVRLLGYLAAAPSPIEWRASSVAEQALMTEIEARQPCDPDAFALRAVTVRPERNRLGEMLRGVVERCSTTPAGTGITADALELMTQMVHENPPSIQLTVEGALKHAEEFARAHPEDPQALTAHADALALAELGSPKPRAVGLEAALARYEEAIARSTPLSGPVAEQHRESNAAFLDLTLAKLAAPNSPERKKFLLGAEGHLRIALAFGEAAPVVAVRALFDAETDQGAAAAATDFTKQPQSRARARATCMLAMLAVKRKDDAAVRHFAELARAPLPPDDRPFDPDELIADTSGTFRVILDEHTLRPVVSLKTALYLTPRCDPAAIKVPAAPPPPPASASGARSTPAPRTAPEKTPSR